MNEEEKERIIKFGKNFSSDVKKMVKNDEEVKKDDIEDMKEELSNSPYYSNRILPEIRKIAGCNDPHDLGTYSDCTKKQKIKASDYLDIFWEVVQEELIKEKSNTEENTGENN
ncbi:MAG: hypothetical protein BTN85_0906 [Candidatus Methanohalarchaeum thermophilum]|uniref:Uncharacterized protein n=1 Tax=Methanohalarchaeum thermophilum TaxID=1903181 RepID=A0A1Q6DVM6_METT1|nr:MAG: hypothetical protein BTN85_0906 [Candidatus Methanohalarchaeum thermophilum]